MAYLTK